MLKVYSFGYKMVANTALCSFSTRIAHRVLSQENNNKIKILKIKLEKKSTRFCNLLCGYFLTERMRICVVFFVYIASQIASQTDMAANCQKTICDLAKKRNIKNMCKKIPDPRTNNKHKNDFDIIHHYSSSGQ